jgi:hypothetical protein
MGQQVTFALRQSLHRVLVMLVQFLPGLLALLLAVVVFTVIGFAAAAIVRRILVALRFDERVASNEKAGSPTSFSDWAPSHSPTLLLSRVTLWVFVLAGVALGVSALDAFYGTYQFSRFLLPYLTHIMGAILLLFVGNLVARFLSRSVLIGAVNAQLQYARFLSLGVKWLVLVLTAAMAIDHLQIGGAVVELAFGILFGGIVLTLSLAVGLGSRDLVTRSIEKSIEKPAGRTSEPAPFPEGGQTPRPKLRHF